jgi:HSP20 family protein
MTTPWNELDRTFTVLDRMMRHPPAARRSTAPRPRPCIHETAEGWTVELDLPGVSADHLGLDIDAGVLRVRAARQLPAAATGQSLRRERSAWSVDQRLQIPLSVDATAITATLRDGRLTVRLPRRAPVTRSVPVAAS